MALISILVCFVCCAVCAHRTSYMSSPSIVSIWATAGQTLHYLYTIDVFDPAFVLPEVRAGIFRTSADVYILFSALCMTCAASTLTPKFKVGIEDISFRITKRQVPFVFAISAVSSVAIFFYLASADMDIFWRSGIYLAMKSPKYLLVENMIVTFALQALGLLGILCSATFAASLASRQNSATSLIAPAALFLLSYQLASNSRSAAVYALAFVAAWLAVRPRDRIVPVTGTVAAVVFWVSALEGRARESGLSQIPSNLAFAIKNIFSEKTPFYISNALEGPFVMFRGALENVKYAETYKTLSFSPLPSFIDGFSSISRANAHRVSANVPMSGFIEAMKFGAIYEIALFASIFLSMTLTNKLSTSRGGAHSSIAAGLHFLLAFSIVSLGAYSTRTTFRYIVAIAIISFAILMYDRTSKNRSSVIRAGSLDNKDSGRSKRRSVIRPE